MHFRRRISALAAALCLLCAPVCAGEAPVPDEYEQTEPDPTAEPTEEPTAEPTEEPTTEPTEGPTVEPTADPTEEPTTEPTEEPTAEPTEEPTSEPTVPPPTAPEFTISLPAEMALTLEGGTAVIRADGVSGLAEGQTVNVSVRSANGFRLRSGEREVEYALSCGGQPIADGGTAACFAGDGAVQLCFTVFGNPGAGTYTDTLTFAVSLTGGDMAE